MFITIPKFLELTNRTQGIPFDDLFIRVAPGIEISSVTDSLHRRWGSVDGVFIIETEEIREALEVGITLTNRLFAWLLGLFLLVAVISLVINLNASVLERSYELGVIQALGLSPVEVQRSLQLEGVAIAVASMVMGIVCGLIVSWMLILFVNITSPVNLVFALPVTVFGALIIATPLSAWLGAWWPAREITRRSPVDLLRSIPE